MDTNVSDLTGNANADQRLEDAWARRLCVHGLVQRDHCIAENQRHGVLTRLARFDVRTFPIVFSQIRPRVLVRSGGVVVLGMIVIAVGVNVQRRHLG